MHTINLKPGVHTEYGVTGTEYTYGTWKLTTRLVDDATEAEAQKITDRMNEMLQASGCKPDAHVATRTITVSEWTP